MVLIYYLIFIALCLKEFDLFYWRKWITFACLTLFLFYLGFQSGKVGLILSQLNDRLPQNFAHNFKSPELKNERVVASFEYYYELEKRGAIFCPYQIPVSSVDKMKYQLDTFQCSYLLVSRQDLNSHTILEYLQTGQISEVKQFSPFPSSTTSEILLPGPQSDQNGFSGLGSYRGILFRRNLSSARLP